MVVNQIIRLLISNPCFVTGSGIRQTGNLFFYACNVMFSYSIEFRLSFLSFCDKNSEGDIKVVVCFIETLYNKRKTGQFASYKSDLIAHRLPRQPDKVALMHGVVKSIRAVEVSACYPDPEPTASSPKRPQDSPIVEDCYNCLSAPVGHVSSFVYSRGTTITWLNAFKQWIFERLSASSMFLTRHAALLWPGDDATVAYAIKKIKWIKNRYLQWSRQDPTS